MKITQSSKNVFDDIGFGKEEAENLRIRSELMIEITRHIEREGLTQAQAAKRLGVSQPRISNLMRGKISLFSVDTLISMLSNAGLEVSVRVRKPKAA